MQTKLTSNEVDTSIVTSRLSSKVINFTRDMTAANGDVAYTGIGFVPSVIIFMGFVGTYDSMWSVVDSGKHANGLDRNNNAWQLMSAFGTDVAVTLVSAANAYQQAIIKTFDADGFTLTWAKINSPTGTGNITAICFR